MATDSSEHNSAEAQPERLSLNGTVVAVIEARMQEQFSNLVRRYGGVPYLAPAVAEVYDLETPGLREWVKEFAAGKFDVIMLQTGVGTRALLRAAEALGIYDGALAALKDKFVIVRGPKPAGVLRGIGITPSVFAPTPHTTADVISTLTEKNVDFKGKRVGMQEYGAPNEVLHQWFERAGATVKTVQPYRWAIPADVQPLLNLIRDLDAGKVPVVAFTSQSQVEHLFEVAQKHGLEATLRRALQHKTAMASVGPVCTVTLAKYGIKPTVEPENPKMGPLIQEIAKHVAATGAPKR